MIGVVSIGLGNSGSVMNMLAKVGVEARKVTTVDELDELDELDAGISKLILPGVGRFDAAVALLEQTGLRAGIVNFVAKGGSLLGICLGMQLLFESSEEGPGPGLGLIAGQVRRFNLPAAGLHKVPHMGWNDVQVRPGILWPHDAEPQRFYFTHSFHAQGVDEVAVVGTAHHGYDFVCAVERDRVMGVQFHPEKSHRYGMQLLQRFCLGQKAEEG